MRLMMLTWEYPPRIVGGIARHVEEIAWSLAARGHEVHVVTSAFEDAPAEETTRGVSVHRVPAFEPADNFIHWVQQLNAAMSERARLILTEWTAQDGGRTVKQGDGIILHAHDWVSHYSAAALKHQFRLPMVATIHATEHGRNRGIHTETQRYINSVEWQLAYEAWHVIVCSEFMRGRVASTLGTPWDKMTVIANGIHADKFAFEFGEDERAEFRARFALPDQKLLFWVGRMVPEKGAHLLIEAAARLRYEGLPVKVVIVGGGKRTDLEDLAARLSASDIVLFTGFVPDDVLLRLYKVIDVACFPSTYEPFGIVALEAMAAGVPVVVSDAGGLAEIVQHDLNGTTVYAGDPTSLAWGIRRVLSDNGHARWLAENARRDALAIFNWGAIAEQTDRVYDRVWSEYCASDWYAVPRN